MLLLQLFVDPGTGPGPLIEQEGPGIIEGTFEGPGNIMPGPM